MTESLAASPAHAVVLGKRKRAKKPSELVLHLSGGSQGSSSPTASSFAPSVFEHETELDIEADVAGPSGLPNTPGKTIIINGKLVKDETRRYHCTVEGCQKSYRKPSRLEEHERSHTGERPFVCTTCSKAYLRESHLQAHVRSHLPESARPLVCVVNGCSKRFWTSQHLKVHENMHSGNKPFKCLHGSCEENFSKHGQLRAHIASAHCPPGTKPFRCEHSGCDGSFATSQKLRAHSKIHDDQRYTCSHQSCVEGSGKPFFATWSALRLHMRSAHPITCPYASCNGKKFTAQKGLRAHVKIHEQRELEDALNVGRVDVANDADESDFGCHRKRRRGGEVGRDWVCAEEGCEKDFKSKKAMTVHYNVSHLRRRDFPCPHTQCGLSFGYKHLLQRHMTKFHSTQPTQKDDVEQADTDGDSAPVTQFGLIDMLTGKGYADRAKDRLAAHHSLRCPFPEIPPSLNASPTLASEGTGNTDVVSATKDALKDCDYVFSRAYDLHRHLRVAHGLIMERQDADTWVRRAKRGL